MQDLISVIMPVKNGEKYIKEAIDNIKKQNMNVEIIVIDDGSNDSTSEIAKEYGCKVIKNDISKGQVAAKNMGIKSANGKYIMFHDHDDIMRDNALNILYEELSQNPEIYAVEAKVKDFYTPEMSEEEKNTAPVKQEPYWGLFTGAILMRKSIFDIIGEFNENINTGEIIDWQMRMDRNNFKIKKLDIISTDRRIHYSNFGRIHREKEFKDYASILRAKLRK